MIAATPADSDGQELAGQVALVTGAASGLGRAYAARLARMGATLVLNNRDGAGRAGIESLAAEIRAQGGHVLTNFESV
jgi:NAD(P)-dependent dehydrogenase (short-subunit alcohol dehydrogenase family)